MTLLARCLFALSVFAPFGPQNFFTTRTAESSAAAPAVEYLFFNASWCGPCQKVRPVVERLNAKGYRFQIVDVDRQPELARRYKITGIPAFVAVADGNVIDRHVGYQDAAELEDFVFQTSRSVRNADPAQDSDTASKPEIPGAVKVEPLLRVTYAVPEEKAEALIAFLKEHSAAEFDAEVDGDRLRIIAAPEVQQALGPFVQTVLQH